MSFISASGASRERCAIANTGPLALSIAPHRRATVDENGVEKHISPWRNLSTKPHTGYQLGPSFNEVSVIRHETTRLIHLCLGWGQIIGSNVTGVPLNVIASIGNAVLDIWRGQATNSQRSVT